MWAFIGFLVVVAMLEAVSHALAVMFISFVIGAWLVVKILNRAVR